jgi:molybdate transport system ATP-binding protein
MALKIRIIKRQGDFEVDVQIEIPSTGVTALFGRSGSGKTSIINMVSGLVRPDSGEVSMNRGVWYDSELGIWAPAERRRCGYVFQDGRLFPHMSVRENLEYGMRLTEKSQRYARLDQVCEILGISALLERRPARLSGGEKQRVAIGRALLASPKLLLMDEPLASLDDDRKSEVLPFISRLTREFSVPIIYVSHAVSEIRLIAHQVAHVDCGGIKWYGKISDFLGAGNNPALNPQVLSEPHNRLK